MSGTAADPNAAAVAPTPSRRRRNYVVWSAIAAFVATRIYLYGFMIAGVSDVTVYFPYAMAGVDHAKLPYRDFLIEYPPVAYWIVRLPRDLSDWRFPAEKTDRMKELVDEFLGQREEYLKHGDESKKPVVSPELKALEAEYNLHLNHYDWGFRFEMLAADIAAFTFFGLMFRRRHPALAGWALWTYVVTTLMLGYLLFDRLDIGLTMLLLAWAWCWLRADGPVDRSAGRRVPISDTPPASEWLWSAAGYAALGIGVGYKLIPVIVVPFALLVDFFRILRPGRDLRVLFGPAVLLAAAVGPFAWYYHLVGKDLGRMFTYHADRGLQIESSYATVLMIVEPWSSLVCYYDYGSWNLRGTDDLTRVLLMASTWLMLAVLAVLGLRSLATWLFRERYDRTAAVRMGAVAVAAATLLAKVLSPQYLIWSLPMLLWGIAELLSPRVFKVACVGAVVMAGCTAFLFPCHYVDSLRVPPYRWGDPEKGIEPREPYWSLIHSGIDARPTSSEGVRVQADVQEIVFAVYQGQVDVALKYTHPRGIEMMGGAEKTRKFLKSIKIPDGMKLEKFEFPSQPIFLRGSENEFVIVPTKSVMTLGEKRAEGVNYQFGARPIGAADWRYVDGSRVTPDNIYEVFPDFPRDYEFPSTFRPDPLAASRLSPHWLPPTVLILRNAILGLLTAAVVIAACRRKSFA